jgi:hypothetical protein
MVAIRSLCFLPLVYPLAGYQGHTFSAALAYPVFCFKVFAYPFLVCDPLYAFE